MHVMGLGEGLIAEGLGAIQARYPETDIGSYPFYRASGNGVTLVASGTDALKVENAIAEIRALILSFGGTPIPGEPLPEGS